MNDKTVTLNGEKIPMYEATQIQRGIERKIRYWKRQRDALSAAKQENASESAKVLEWKERMRKFISQSNLQRQSVREQI